MGFGSLSAMLHSTWKYWAELRNSLPSMASDGFLNVSIKIRFCLNWSEVFVDLRWPGPGFLDLAALRYTFPSSWTWILTSTTWFLTRWRVLHQVSAGTFWEFSCSDSLKNTPNSAEPETRHVRDGNMSVSREHCMERVWPGWLCVWSLLIFSRNGTCYIWLSFRNIGWRFPPRKFLQHVSVCVCANIAVMKTSVPNIKCHWHRQSLVNMKSIKLPTKPNAHDNLGPHAVWMYMIQYIIHYSWCNSFVISFHICFVGISCEVILRITRENTGARYSCGIRFVDRT